MKFERLIAFRNKKLAHIIEPILLQGNRILDFGCGEGSLAFKVLNECRDKGKSVEMAGFDPFVTGGHITKLSSLSEVSTYNPDVVLLIDVIHHIHEGVVETLQNLMGCLSPDTRIIVKDVIIKENWHGKLQFKENLLLDKISMHMKKAKYQFSSYYTLREFHSLFDELSLKIMDYQEVKIEPIIFNSSGLFVLVGAA